MIYRLITVWSDAEEQNRIQRAAKDFASTEEIEAHIAGVQEAGLTRIDLQGDPMPGGALLASVFVPLNRIAGWYIWQLPDDNPSWPITEVKPNED